MTMSSPLDPFVARGHTGCVESLTQRMIASDGATSSAQSARLMGSSSTGGERPCPPGTAMRVTRLRAACGCDPAKELHLVVAGRFAILATLSTGEEAMLRIMGPGEIFGEMALLEVNGSRSATVRSIDPGATAAIDRKAFDDARRLHPGVSDILLSILAEKVRQSDGRLLEALFVPAEVRVLRRLVELVDLLGDADGPITIPLRQEDLASLAGTSRATVNRVLRAEEVRGAVELQRGRTIVLDRAGLDHRADTLPPPSV